MRNNVEHWNLDLAEGLYVERDEAHAHWNGPGSGWPTHGCVKPGDRAAYVRVMSIPAGGQIRAYIQHNGCLLLQGPAYTGDWPELDASVSRALGIPVAPYTVNAGGRVEVCHA